MCPADKEIKEVVEIRDDENWITDDYLAASCHMVAQQFIASEATYASREAFAEKAEYVMRQHCPITYAFFFQRNEGQSGELPFGTLEIILKLVEHVKPEIIGGIVKPKLELVGQDGEFLVGE